MLEVVFVSRRGEYAHPSPIASHRAEQDELRARLNRLDAEDLIALEDDILTLLTANVVTTRLDRSLGSPSALHRSTLLLP